MRFAWTKLAPRRIIGGMDKQYFVDVYWFRCPKCDGQNSNKAYFGVFEKAEIGAAKHAGLLSYTCTHCGESFPSNRVMTNGEVFGVAKEQALANGLAFESAGSA